MTMITKKIILICLGVSLWLCASYALAANPKAPVATAASDTAPLSDQGQWAWTLYYSKMTTKLLNQVLRFQIKTGRANLYSGEINYRLAPSNPLSQFFQQVGAKFEVNGNFTYQNDPVGNIYEFNPYFNVRWINFPWNHYLTTTFAIGEGVSYATAIPWREQRDRGKAINGKRLENLLMFEATFALPSHPDWQVLYRVHHRSGVFGMYDSSNSGSTAVGVGVRHYFNW